MAAQKNDNRAVILEEALTRFVDVYLRGEQPDIDEFVGQYPQCEVQLKERIQDLQEIDSLFDSLVHADESDFESAVAVHDLVGQKLASFEVEKMIGRGGMGVVYLARDTKLDRSVAIKSMPAKLTGDSTSRMRFRREAKLLASLNHPNIAVIHDIIEQDEGASYLVLEYVPGQTLAERIARKSLKLEETLLIGRQVAEAVSAAHKKGIVHRDLKPGNIKITPDDRVKVLDFGLAKASVSKSRSGDTTVTQPGHVIGTPAYMSPEQARGKPTDHRTDIWSFGCIMYEMLTGHVPFEGETATDTIARIIEREPDWELLPERTPMNIRVLLHRCLEKDPSRRLQHIADAALEIHETLNLLTAAPSATAPSPGSFESKVLPKTKSRRIAVIVAAIGIILSVIAVQLIWRNQTGPTSKEKVLVVLPFKYLGPSEDEYFAAGITDAITARLADIHGLGVISRQSSLQYKNTEKNTKQIGEELGVDYILEGTVQCERPSDPSSQIRIVPQLIRVSDDRHIWAQTYDDDMSEIFRVQSELAVRVAQALDVKLPLQPPPTKNMEAYNYYLRGNTYIERGCYDLENARIALQMYQKAVELDPTFALAYARLPIVHLSMYWYRHDRSDSRLYMAKEAIDILLQLAPDLPETHKALGYNYYWGYLDYEHALEQFAIAKESRPNDHLLLVGIGAVQRRQGKFEQALASFKKAFQLDPRSSLSPLLIGETYALLRNYPEAERYCDRAIALSPDSARLYGWKIKVSLSWHGNTEKARVVLDQALENVDINDDDLLAHLGVLLEIFDGNYQKAQEMLSEGSSDAFNTETYSMPKALLRGQVSGLMANQQLEYEYYDSARVMLETRIQEQPENAQLHSALGIAYAGLGRKTDAIRQGQSAVELLPIAKEAWGGLFMVENLARIYLMVGEFDAAIEKLEFLLSIPSELSIPLLRLDPAWDPLRDHPRFKKLIEAGN